MEAIYERELYEEDRAAAKAERAARRAKRVRSGVFMTVTEST